MKNSLTGQRLWSYVDGTSLKPIDKKYGKYEKDLKCGRLIIQILLFGIIF